MKIFCLTTATWMNVLITTLNNSENIKSLYLILPWDLPTVPGISQKIPPHTSKIKQTWLNQIYSIIEIQSYFAVLYSNGFCGQLNNYGIKLLFCTAPQEDLHIHTQQLWVEKSRPIKISWELVLAYSHTNAFPQMVWPWASSEIPT